MKVSVFGLGYVGSVTASCLASAGFEVVGVDRDPHKVGELAAGRSPIVEKGLDRVVQAADDLGLLTATTSADDALRDCDVTLVCVGTPSRPNGSLDVSFIERVVEQLGDHLATIDDYHVVVIRSTVLPGTVEEVVIPLLEARSGKRAGYGFGVAMCPEFLRESSAVADFFDPSFTIVGADDERTASVLRELFGFIDGPLHVVPVATAESVKYASNCFHAAKVVFANEMARFCSSQDVDSHQVMHLLCQDDRLNISPAYLEPGFAFGGSCLPKDLRALVHRARVMDQDLPMLSALLESNEQHLRRAVQLVLDAGATRVGLLGLSFKSGTDDLRESPHVALAETLLGKGIDLQIYDSNVRPERLVGANRAYVQERLPHLHRILADDLDDVVTGVRCVVLGSRERPIVDAVLAAEPPIVIDLVGAPHDVRRLPGYVGLAW